MFGSVELLRGLWLDTSQELWENQLLVVCQMDMYMDM